MGGEARAAPHSAIVLRICRTAPTLEPNRRGWTGAKPEKFAMRDPYEVLGVKKNADAATIKSAYRKLAKKLHPDANKTDPKAAQRFAELNSAYELLGEDDKRKAYDRGEIDAEGKPKFRGFEGFGPGGGFGRAGRAGSDFSYEHFSFGPEGARRSGDPRRSAIHPHLGGIGSAHPDPGRFLSWG